MIPAVFKHRISVALAVVVSPTYTAENTAINIQAPSSTDGGDPNTVWHAVASPGGATATNTGAYPSLTITGLTNLTAYTVQVWGTNAGGTGSSVYSGSLTPSLYAGTSIPGFQSSTFSQTQAYTGSVRSTGFSTFPNNTGGGSGLSLGSNAGINYNIATNLAGTDFQVRFTLLTSLSGGAYASGGGGLGWLDGGANQYINLNATAAGTYSLQVQTELREKYENQTILSTQTQTINLTIS